MIDSNKTQEQDITSLKDLEGNGWYNADPPALDADMGVVGLVDGFQVRVPPRFELSESPITKTEDKIHRRFRTGKYNVDLRLHIAGDIVSQGEIKVDEAEGYDENK